MGTSRGTNQQSYSNCADGHSYHYMYVNKCGCGDEHYPKCTRIGNYRTPKPKTPKRRADNQCHLNPTQTILILGMIATIIICVVPIFMEFGMVAWESEMNPICNSTYHVTKSSKQHHIIIIIASMHHIKVMAMVKPTAISKMIITTTPA
jgi:hypothetical protein